MLGDDIGLEVVPECVKVMKAAAAKTGLEVEWQEFPIGQRGHELHGHTMPQVTVDGLEDFDGWIMGPIGHDAYPRNDPTWIMPPLRKKFDLFASIKPVKSYPNIKSVHKNVDIVFLREVTEGMQSSDTVIAGNGEFRPNDEISIGTRVVTRKGANRVAREAFEIARTRPRKNGDRPCTRSRSIVSSAACSPKSAARWRRNFRTASSTKCWSTVSR